MKKGKTAKIIGFKTAKVIYGTVDSINLKSLYLNIQTWVEPIEESENWTRVVLNLSRGVKHSIYETINKKIFTDKFIVDLDLRSSGLNMGKKSFMNLEINFYLKNTNLDFKSLELQTALINVVNTIHENNFYQNKYFTFHLTKSKNKQEIKQMELA